MTCAHSKRALGSKFTHWTHDRRSCWHLDTCCARRSHRRRTCRSANSGQPGGTRAYSGSSRLRTKCGERLPARRADAPAAFRPVVAAPRAVTLKIRPLRPAIGRPGNRVAGTCDRSCVDSRRGSHRLPRVYSDSGSVSMRSCTMSANLLTTASARQVDIADTVAHGDPGPHRARELRQIPRIFCPSSPSANSGRPRTLRAWPNPSVIG